MPLDGQIDQERRVIRLEVRGGTPNVRESLGWRLTSGIPQCNLVAMHQSGALELLLPSTATITTELVRERITRLVERLNEFHPAEVPLRIEVVADSARLSFQRASA